MAGWNVAVSGLIGSGKSTLVRGLAPALDLEPFEERVQANPYFEAFYRDPETWAFKSFVAFFDQTLAAQRQARTNERGGVQERVLREHLDVFGAEFHARGYLDRRDWRVLNNLVRAAENLLPPPDILIYLEISPSAAFERVRARGDDAETPINLEYLEALSNRYDSFVEEWPRPVVTVNGQTSDFRREEDVQRLARSIRSRLDP